MLDKAMEDMRKLQLKKEERKKNNLQKDVQIKEKYAKEELAKENREVWMKKKNFEFSKKSKERSAQIEFEKLKVGFISLLFCAIISVLLTLFSTYIHLGCKFYDSRPLKNISP